MLSRLRRDRFCIIVGGMVCLVLVIVTLEPNHTAPSLISSVNEDNARSVSTAEMFSIGGTWIINGLEGMGRNGMNKRKNVRVHGLTEEWTACEEHVPVVEQHCDGALTLSDQDLELIGQDKFNTLDELATAVAGHTEVKKSLPLRKTPKKYDLLINSYMSSGSRFTGQMFGFRKEAFFIYEPLWQFATWTYYDCDNLACSLTESMECCKETAERVNRRNKIDNISLAKDVPRGSSVTDLMIDVLDDMYSCNFSRLEHVFLIGLQDVPSLGGPIWDDFRECLKANNTKMMCLTKHEEKCRQSSHVISKILRLTTGSYERLLKKRENLKLVHLYRNPFAIVNSRAETAGYPISDHGLTAAVLCKKMAVDLEGALDLAAKFPDRIKIVFYEDVKTNVTDKVEKLYEFIGMTSNIEEIKKLDKVSVNQANTKSTSVLENRVADNTRWWRNHMSFEQYAAIRSQCGKLMTAFRITDFENRTEMLDFNLPDLNLPNVFMV